MCPSYLVLLPIFFKCHFWRKFLFLFNCFKVQCNIKCYFINIILSYLLRREKYMK
ncbi:hypothetical protein MtrunA17_Chr3g0110541 [Medicago truncatula]|nr:hypothetical protein MtrunA17_Chr3g0110541 [Medicago truncatula]